MFLFAHLIIGLIIGKLTNHYLFAILFAVVIDLDHLIPYIKNKIIFKPKELFKTITTPEDPYGNQRNYFHSFFVWASISVVLLIINFNIGLVISLSWLSHLLLDLLDGSDYYPFYPIRDINVKGPIRYLSMGEIIFTIILLLTFLIL